MARASDSGFTQDGTHAEFVALPAGGCAEIPKNLSFAEAAACGVPYTTAWDGVSRAKVGPGTKFLVTGANGSVGRAAIALGHALGARVVAAVRRPEMATALEGLGYQTLLLGAPESLGEQVLAKFGAYADAIFETTGAWLPACVRAAEKHGAICVIAPPGMGKLTVDFPVLDFYRRGLTLFGVNTLLHDTVACAKMLTEFSGLFQSGALPPAPAVRNEAFGRARSLSAGQSRLFRKDRLYTRMIWSSRSHIVRFLSRCGPTEAQNIRRSLLCAFMKSAFTRCFPLCSLRSRRSGFYSNLSRAPISSNGLILSPA